LAWSPCNSSCELRQPRPDRRGDRGGQAAASLGRALRASGTLHVRSRRSQRPAAREPCRERLSRRRASPRHLARAGVAVRAARGGGSQRSARHRSARGGRRSLRQALPVPTIRGKGQGRRLVLHLPHLRSRMLRAVHLLRPLIPGDQPNARMARGRGHPGPDPDQYDRPRHGARYRASHGGHQPMLCHQRERDRAAGTGPLDRMRTRRRGPTSGGHRTEGVRGAAGSRLCLPRTPARLARARPEPKELSRQRVALPSLRGGCTLRSSRGAGPSREAPLHTLSLG